MTLSVLLTGIVTLYLIESNYIKGKEEKLLTNATLIETIIEENYLDKEKVNFYRLAQELSDKSNSRVTFFRLDGSAIADSINNSIILDKSNITREFKSGVKWEKDITRRYSEEIGERFFYLTVSPIKVGDMEVALRLGDTYNYIDHLMEDLLIYFIMIIGLSLGLATIISYFTTNRIVKPIKQLEEASKLIVEGDFDNQIMVNSQNEISSLANAFNRMSSELKENIGKLQEKNIEQETILSSIEDGILALDLEDTIILLNAGVEKVLNIDREIRIGENFKTIFENIKEISNEEINKINQFGYCNEIEIKDLEKIIRIESYPLKDKNDPQTNKGVLIILRDITELRKLEKMRKEFVANVSHELRTPLTSISGFIETLKIKKLDKSDQEKALDIIGVETEKLQNMIDELLVLSKIEGIKKDRSMEPVNIEKIIDDLIKLLEPQIREKNIKITSHIKENSSLVTGDEELLRLILKNLIENSIKYGKINGNTKIRLSNYGDRGIEIIIEDDGIGIAEKDMEWIFERFYRVKQSRSLNKEGSGLGLSITKEVVHLLGGSIEVKSTLNKGSKFIIRLPST